VSHQNGFRFGDLIGTSEKATDRRVVKSMELRGDVVLLGMRMQGILRKDQASTLDGPEIWDTKKTPFIQHAHDSHLRVDGKAVEITRESPTTSR